jgi:hypothetical protein
MSYRIETTDDGRRWTEIGSLQSRDAACTLADMAARRTDAGVYAFAGVRVREGALVVYEPQRAA